MLIIQGKTYILVMADALNEQDPQLRFALPDVLHKKPAAMNSAVCGIEDTYSTALLEQIIQELIQSVKRHLFAQLGSGFILGIKELGRLVHCLRGNRWIARIVQVQL